MKRVSCILCKSMQNDFCTLIVMSVLDLAFPAFPAPYMRSPPVPMDPASAQRDPYPDHNKSEVPRRRIFQIAVSSDRTKRGRPRWSRETHRYKGGSYGHRTRIPQAPRGPVVPPETTRTQRGLPDGRRHLDGRRHQEVARGAVPAGRRGERKGGNPEMI